MTDTTTTRRTMLAAIAALPAIGLTASAAQAQQGVSPALLEKIARWKAAEADFGDSTALFEAHTAWKAACEKIPHRDFPELHDALYAGGNTTEHPTSTATSWLVDMTRRVRAGDRIGRGANDDWRAACLKIAEAADERDAEVERLRVVYRLDELGQEADDACDRAAELMGEALRHPAQSIADVLHKLEIMDEADQDGGYTREIVTADLLRLAAGRA